jgi:hypothetical protein
MAVIRILRSSRPRTGSCRLAHACPLPRVRSVAEGNAQYLPEAPDSNAFFTLQRIRPRSPARPRPRSWRQPTRRTVGLDGQGLGQGTNRRRSWPRRRAGPWSGRRSEPSSSTAGPPARLGLQCPEVDDGVVLAEGAVGTRAGTRRPASGPFGRGVPEPWREECPLCPLPAVLPFPTDRGRSAALAAVDPLMDVVRCILTASAETGDLVLGPPVRRASIAP